MVFYDKFGRTWKGRKIVWIRSANCSSLALYRWADRDGKRVLVYDKKRGMYDKDGYNVKETRIDIIPALEGRDKDGRSAPGTWERFPDTEEAYKFIKSITQNGLANQEQENIVVTDFNDEYDEEIIIK